MKKNVQAVIVVFAVILVCVLAARSNASVNYTSIYNDHAKKLSEKYGKEYYQAIVDSDEPVLIVTDAVYEDIDLKKPVSAQGSLYQYSKEQDKVVYIGKWESSNTANPLLIKDNMLQCASHHGSYSLRAKGGKGYVNGIDQLNISQKNPKSVKYTLKNGRIINRKIKSISNDEALNLFDKYYDFEGGKIITFTPVTD